VRRNSTDCKCAARSLNSAARDIAANEVKNLTDRALPHWHVKLFIVFRSTFKEKFLTWVDWLSGAEKGYQQAFPRPRRRVR
ncbi:hypothetical protein, partial [Janthinobacterium sp. CG3]|uniref:hypothetical protein n=1 Tax=Janthinobacterium sp. CG3 TaxID=1075768 RepID=UPI001E372272